MYHGEPTPHPRETKGTLTDGTEVWLRVSGRHSTRQSLLTERPDLALHGTGRDGKEAYDFQKYVFVFEGRPIGVSTAANPASPWSPETKVYPCHERGRNVFTITGIGCPVSLPLYEPPADSRFEGIQSSPYYHQRPTLGETTSPWRGYFYTGLDFEDYRAGRRVAFVSHEEQDVALPLLREMFCAIRTGLREEWLTSCETIFSDALTTEIESNLLISGTGEP
jgi:hypothetical protein